MTRWLCTDLDRTLIPNGEQPESPGARELLFTLLERAGIRLAYVSGRDLRRVLEGIGQWSLLRPDAIIADVGTRIFRRVGESWQADEAWQLRISADWAGQSRERVIEALADIEALEAQADDRLGPHKMSYTLALDEPFESLAPLLRERLSAASLSSALVYSLDPENRVALLDVLPMRATKRHAVEFLRDTDALSNDEVVFSGDSGNDLDVLISELPSVLVANGDEETRRLASAGAEHAGTASQLYLARGVAPLAAATDSSASEAPYWPLNGHYAGGMIEGLLHFWPDLAPVFRDILSHSAPDSSRIGHS